MLTKFGRHLSMGSSVILHTDGQTYTQYLFYKRHLSNTRTCRLYGRHITGPCPPSKRRKHNHSSVSYSASVCVCYTHFLTASFINTKISHQICFQSALGSCCAQVAVFVMHVETIDSIFNRKYPKCNIFPERQICSDVLYHAVFCHEWLGGINLVIRTIGASWLVSLLCLINTLTYLLTYNARSWQFTIVYFL